MTTRRDTIAIERAAGMRRDEAPQHRLCERRRPGVPGRSAAPSPSRDADPQRALTASPRLARICRIRPELQRHDLRRQQRRISSKRAESCASTSQSHKLRGDAAIIRRQLAAHCGDTGIAVGSIRLRTCGAANRAARVRARRERGSRLLLSENARRYLHPTRDPSQMVVVTGTRSQNICSLAANLSIPASSSVREPRPRPR